MKMGQGMETADEPTQARPSCPLTLPPRPQSSNAPSLNGSQFRAVRAASTLPEGGSSALPGAIGSFAHGGKGRKRRTRERGDFPGKLRPSRARRRLDSTVVQCSVCRPSARMVLMVLARMALTEVDVGGLSCTLDPSLPLRAAGWDNARLSIRSTCAWGGQFDRWSRPQPGCRLFQQIERSHRLHVRTLRPGMGADRSYRPSIRITMVDDSQSICHRSRSLLEFRKASRW